MEMKQDLGLGILRGLTRVAGWTGMAGVLLFILGCGQPESGDRQETGLSGLPTIRIAYPGISATIWPLEYGVQKGFFQAAGVDLEMNRIRGVPQIMATLMSGDIDVAWVGFDGMASAVAQGAGDLRLIAEFLTEFPLYILVPPEISKLSDLKGETVATAGAGSITDIIFYEALKRGGLTDPRKDTDYVNMHGPDNRLVQLFNGTFMAVCLNPPWSQLAEAEGYKVIEYIGDFLQPWAGEGPITHTRVIDHNRAGLQGVVSGLKRSIVDMEANRAEAVRIAADYMELDVALAEKLYDIMMPVLRSEGNFNEEGIQRSLDNAAQTGQKVEASEILDYSFLSSPD